METEMKEIIKEKEYVHDENTEKYSHIFHRPHILY